MDEKQLYGLMAIAEEQQKSVKAAIDGLTAERAALAKERAALSAVVAASVRQALEGAASVSAKALEAAAKPVIGRLDGVVQAAADAEGSMRRAGAWFAWKWVAVAAGGLVGVCLVAYAALAWQIHEVNDLTSEKAELTAQVAQMQANVSALKSRGGNIVMTTCGGRTCIEASSNQGHYSNGTAIPLGGWKTDNGNGKVPLVIPRGY